MSQRRVVIIGGGITGLAAAHALKQLQNTEAIECTLLESTPRVGGKIYTHREDNLLLDMGPSALLDTSQAASTLIRELGVGAEIVAAQNVGPDTHILTGGRLLPVPQAILFGIPTSWQGIWNHALVSPKGKFRVLADYLLPKLDRPKNGHDQSLGLFLRRRLGDEWVTNVCEPLIANASGTSVDDLSLDATYPVFEQLERRYRSLLIGVRRSRLNGDESTARPSSWRSALSTLRGQTDGELTLRNGLQTLTERLFDELTGFAEIRTECNVLKIARTDSGKYSVQMTTGDDEQTVTADAVIVTTPASVAGQLLCGLSAKAAKLSAIRYVSTATVILGYSADALTEFKGFGFRVARNEASLISSCSVVSRMWPHTANNGRALIRCDVGRAGSQDWMSMDDVTIAREVETQLREILAVQAKPWFTRVMRWQKAIPQYEVGHKDLVDEVESQLALDAPGIFIAGAGYHGIGVPDCIRSGKNAATSVAAFLQSPLQNHRA